MKTTIIAVENQSLIHYAMSLRVMAMDALNYYNQWLNTQKKYQEMRKKKKQQTENVQTNKTEDAAGEGITEEYITEKDITDENVTDELKGLIKLSNAEFLSGFRKTDRLIPVTTIVLYFGEKEWDGPRCLKDILDLDGLPKEMIDYISNYPMHLVEVRKFEDYESFQTEWKWIFGFLQRDKDKDALKQYVKDNAAAFQNLSEDTYDMITQFSRSKMLKGNREDFITEGGKVDVCKALDDMCQEAFEEGEAHGIEIGENRGMIHGIVCATITMCKNLGKPMEYAVKQIALMCSMTENEAQELALKYWK